ncbi:hypothetical protein [Cytobacillus kochii]
MKKMLFFLVLFIPFFTACNTDEKNYDLNTFSYGLGEENSNGLISFEIEIIVPSDSSMGIKTNSIKPVVSTWVENKIIDINIDDIKNGNSKKNEILNIKGTVAFDRGDLDFDELEKKNQTEQAFKGITFTNKNKDSYEITYINEKLNIEKNK